MLRGKFGIRNRFIEFMNNDLLKFFQGKRVLVTGHTGFKGSWLCLLLNKIGAEVSGYALNTIDKKSLFDLAKISQKVNSNIGDIRDLENLKRIVSDFKPEIVFHLAAQPLVRDSYKDPVYNYQTNIIGSVNIFEACRNVESVRSIVNVTTDKCYDNKEWCWPYRESDHLGGYDPYSASKACSEIITNSYRNSFFNSLGIAISSARAGNVIGGGDFSRDRIIPDAVRSIEQGEVLKIRNPFAIRPWQHVLDVLCGYLILAAKSYLEPQKYSDAFNLSPITNENLNVQELIKIFIQALGSGQYSIESDNSMHEAKILKLDCSKAVEKLGWNPKFNQIKAIENSALWYKEYMSGVDIKNYCDGELDNYFNKL